MNMERIAPQTPTAFISYSWEGPEHQAWVARLATRLRGDGVDVTLDQWHVAPGDQLPRFMEGAVRHSDFVLIVCTPHYRERSDQRRSGVGYEGDIMTAEVLTSDNQRKFIPLLRSGTPEEAKPSWLLGKVHIDFREAYDAELSYTTLLNAIYKQLPKAPPLGPPPTFMSEKEPDQAPGTRSHSENVVIAELRAVENGIAAHLRNLGLSPVHNAELMLQHLDHFVERHRNFTRNPFEPMRLVSNRILIGDTVGDGYVFASYYGPQKSELRFSAATYDPGRRSPYPVLKAAGLWRAELAVRVQSQEVGRTERFFRWQPGLDVEFVGDPRPTAATTAVPDDAADELAELGSKAPLLRRVRDLRSTSKPLVVTPIIPSRCSRDEFRVEAVDGQSVTLHKSGSGHQVVVPASRVAELLTAGTQEPGMLVLDGRLQWVSPTRTWRFFPEAPMTPEERQLGFWKPSFPDDARAAQVISRLKTYNLPVRWVRIERLGEVFAQGYEMVYDEDGRCFRWGGPNDGQVLVSLGV